jgi:hypothetical protein
VIVGIAMGAEHLKASYQDYKRRNRVMQRGVVFIYVGKVRELRWLLGCSHRAAMQMKEEKKGE